MDVHKEFFDSWYIRVPCRVAMAVKDQVWIILSVILSSAYLLTAIKPRLDEVHLLCFS